MDALTSIIQVSCVALITSLFDMPLCSLLYYCSCHRGKKEPPKSCFQFSHLSLAPQTFFLCKRLMLEADLHSFQSYSQLT